MPASQTMMLPWAVTDSDEKRFRRIVVITLTATLVIGLIIPFLPVSKRPAVLETEPPSRIAKLIIKKREIQKARPAIKPKPRPVKKKVPVPEQKPAAKPRSIIQPEPMQPKVDGKKLAREKARNSGLLALSDSLADLRDEATANQLKATTQLRNKGSSALPTERSLITSKISNSSKGIDTAALTRDVGTTRLADRGITRIENTDISEAPDIDLPGNASGVAVRSDEEIQLVFDRNKSTIYSLYNRELRRNPSLQGKMVIQLTIAPSGKVTAIKLISSELGLPRLEEKLLQRIKLFNFGAGATEAVTITYPIQFLPS